MENSSRGIWWIVGALTLALCLCGALSVGALALLATQPWDLFADATATPAQTVRISTPSPTWTPTPESGPTEPGAQPETPSAEIRPAVLQRMQQIEDQVVQLRGLVPLGPVERRLLTPDELRQRVMDDFLEDYSQEEARDDVRVLALFGLLPPDYDLFNLYVELYSEQVAGFYDDEEKAMYVVQGDRFGAPQRLTYAHEFDHALQDQHFNFKEGLNYTDEACEVDTERCAAIQALVEGDASLLEEQWLRTFATQDEIRELIEFYDSYESPVFDAAPRFLQQDFLYPYTDGMDFVRRLFDQGGWAAVDAAYGDLPLSTEQILHPERYPDDKPLWLEVPELSEMLGEVWREIDRNVLGELYTFFVLDEFLPEGDARQAADGWGGDYYLAFYNDATDQGLLILVSQWDSVGDAQEFALTFRDYGETRFGARRNIPNGYAWDSDEGYVVFERVSNQTLWILAPDQALAEQARQAIDFPAPTRPAP